MQLNRKTVSLQTHEGATAKDISTFDQLSRSVMSCLLWEKEFYEEGQEITERIASLIPRIDPESVARLAIDAREKMKLRHIPLFIVREMAKLPTHKKWVKSTLARVIQRPDELTEFLALYWADKKQPLSAQVKKGLAQAFTQFSEYQLAKYNRDKAIKLRDVLFLCHAKPISIEQEATWKKLVEGTLPIPDTWEVSLSAGQDKKETWERLMHENKLGALALLRNLRNMREAGVDFSTIRGALSRMKTERVLPFRFISAARYAPDLEPELEKAMFKCLEGTEKIAGRTCLLVDVSGSMDSPISGKSDLQRLDAGCGLAMLLREVCEDFQIRTFSNSLAALPPRRGFALRDAIVNSQPHSSTYLGIALSFIIQQDKDRYDRLIVITDEQSHDKIPDPVWKKAYMINIASAKNGVGYGPYRHIDGWSEAIVDYIRRYENETTEQ